MLLHRGVRFPYVHDLAEHIGLLEQSGQEVPGAVRQAARLTRYAVVTRYPGLFEPVTSEEYEEGRSCGYSGGSGPLGPESNRQEGRRGLGRRASELGGLGGELQGPNP